MDKIIYSKVKLNCSQEESFEMFTKNIKVQTWLAERAIIEPYVGGKYELFWDLDNLETNSTIGCKITAIEMNKLICFQWKGPAQFADFMNETEPLTHVSVMFVPNYNDSSTEIHLVHTGWGSNEDWEEARAWFESVWERALSNLQKIIK